ncbi:MAG: haloacetate dehalogenase [Paracoccaceae bacterium]|jgi:haloacetate dehalogenase
MEAFKNFDEHRIDTGETEIACWTGGSGPPLLLLHGYPQTHVMWHKIVRRLAQRYTIVTPDLRGYGDSGKPASGPETSHQPYSKRAMAADQVAVMHHLGFERFDVCGHDRGGRVAHRMALDHTECVQRLAVLDIVPTYKIYTEADRRIAEDYYHWFFLIQPFDYPERMIGHDVAYYLGKKMGKFSFGEEVFSKEAMAEYLRCFSNPDTIHASCEDYRAAATIDLEHDKADLDVKVKVPLLVLWGKKGAMERNYDVLDAWRERAVDVQGRALPSGHYLAEEQPEETAAALETFFIR